MDLLPFLIACDSDLCSPVFEQNAMSLKIAKRQCIFHLPLRTGILVKMLVHFHIWMVCVTLLLQDRGNRCC